MLRRGYERAEVTVFHKTLGGVGYVGVKVNHAGSSRVEATNIEASRIEASRVRTSRAIVSRTKSNCVEANNNE